MKHLKRALAANLVAAALIALGLLVSSQAGAGTVYVDTAGNGAAATNSGGTDTSTPTASGIGISCSTTTCTITDASINLGTVVTTPGLTQTSINIAGATNTARTLFWVTGVTSGCVGLAVNCVITVDVAPTGTLTGWAVGGRYLFPSGSTADVIDGALGLSGGQDAVIFNTTPATRTGPYITAKNPGTTTTGLISIQGKAGVRPVLQETGSIGSAINLATLGNWKISNLQIACGTSTTDCIQNPSGVGVWIDNVYFSSGGGIALNTVGSGWRITNSEITGFTGVAIAAFTSTSSLVGNYIHNNTSDAVTMSTTTYGALIADNLIVSNGGRGIALTGSPTTQQNVLTIEGNTIANNTGIGIEVGNANYVVNMRNNIIVNTGSVNTVKWDAATAETFGSHAYNIYWNGTASGVSGLTPNGTEFTTNPSFVNSGSGNYAITNSSPAAGSGWPSVGGGFPGTGNSASVGYRDIGAFQRQVTAGGGGIIGGGL